jgi:hypothetical protein
MAPIYALTIKIGATSRNLIPGMTLKPAGFGMTASEADFVAEVVALSADHEVLGLRNLSDRNYRAKRDGSRWFDIGPGQTVRVEDGVVIDFGAIEGRVLSMLAPPPGPVI